MAVDPNIFVLAIGLIIVLAFATHILFQRLRFPDVVLLILLGALLGPGLGWLSVEAIESLIPILTILAIVIILFDGGVRLNMGDLFAGLGPAITLAFLAFGATVVLVGAAYHLLTGEPLVLGILLGLILGGTSTIVIVPLVQAMVLDRRTKTILSLESVMSEVLVVVSVVIYSEALARKAADAQHIAADLVAYLALGLLSGVVAGFLWVSVLRRFFQERTYEYLLTMGVLAIVYVLADFLKGSPAISVLVFGIIVGNARRARRREQTPVGAARTAGRRGAAATPAFDPELLRLHEEVAFFVRAFFFVALGALIDVEAVTDPAHLLIGLVLLAAILLARIWALLLTRGRTRFDPKDLYATWFLHGRGLAAAAMAGVPFTTYMLEGTHDFAAYALLLIILTNLVTAAAVFLLENRPIHRRMSPPRQAEAAAAAKAR